MQEASKHNPRGPLLDDADIVADESVDYADALNGGETDAFGG